MSGKPGDRGRNHHAELMLSNDAAATHIKDGGHARKRDGARKGQEAVPDEHEPTGMFGDGGTDDATDAVGADGATDVVGAHDAMPTGDSGEATVPVDARDITLTVGDAGAHKLQAGSANNHLTTVVGYSQTDDVTQVVDNPETASAKLDDAGDVTQVTVGPDTKTVPTKLSARGGWNDATMGHARGHGKGTSQGEVKVTRNTDETHVLDVSTG